MVAGRGVAAGTHGVAAFARAFRLARQTVELRAADPGAAVDLLLEPTGAIDVTLVDEADRPVGIPDGLEIRAYGVTYVTENEPTDPRDLGRPDHPRTIEFDDLSDGLYRIELERDRVHDVSERTIRFEPLEALGHAEVEVLEGRVAPGRLRVRPRPLVRLRGAPSRGDAVAVALRLDWHDDATGIARVLPSFLSADQQRAGWHFQGHLAPGTYALTFDSGDRVWRETLQVGTESFERTFPLPW